MKARIIVEAKTSIAKVYAPFELKDVVKSLPGRRWDSAGKHWMIPVAFVDELANALRVTGCTVFVTKSDGSPWTSGRSGAGHRSTPASDWAERLLEAVGPDRADRVHKALARVLHPDLEGGSLTLMQQLNNARDRAVTR